MQHVTFKLLILLHLLGSATWIGGHVVVVGVIVPAAKRARSVARIVEFERSFGPIGLAALLVQVGSGIGLAHHWIPDVRAALIAPTLVVYLLAAKLALLTTIIALAAHAHHRILPGLTAERIPSFAAHAWLTTLLSVGLLVVGATIRLGGWT